jgi:hypothetical protein
MLGSLAAVSLVRGQDKSRAGDVGQWLCVLLF